MPSNNSFDPSKIAGSDSEKQILRTGLVSELDAINLYEQLASLTKNESIKNTFQKIIKDEKEHIGELETLLLRSDQEQMQELAEGTKEVEKLDENR